MNIHCDSQSTSIDLLGNMSGESRSGKDIDRWFLEVMLRVFPFFVKCVQINNGFEFTKRFGNSKSN